jgi:pimeloyl-ACP methyl ester carboxylesterase
MQSVCKFHTACTQLSFEEHPMATITLPHGTVNYLAAGPPDGAAAAPIVFVHGVLVSGTLWSATAEALAAGGARAFAPDLPLGAHHTPVGPAVDQTPRGVARQVLAFLEALELEDVTLVGNDTGGAICQYLVDTDASRIGRLVLTNCDAFEHFPPPELRRFITLLRHPAALAAAGQALRSTRLRHGRFGFGPFARGYDAEMTAAWVEPLRDAEIRGDLSRFARDVDAADLVAVGARLPKFGRPVRLVWGTADPYFTLDLAHRLAAAFGDAEIVDVVEVAGARTFVPLDAPDRLAAEIIDLSAATASQRSMASERTAQAEA